MKYFIISTKNLKTLQYLAIAFLFCGLVLQSTSGNASPPPTAGKVAIQTKQALNKQLVEKWGIELTALRMTAAGRMIDFRYRVVDKDKAAPLHQRQIKPYLLHKPSGKVLAVPNTAKVGALRNSNMPKQDRIYWMFFGNNGVVKTGDKVSVIIGNFRADDLVVE